MITVIEKDITTVTKGILAHGVNCQGAMGSGVALALKNKFPIIYVRYMNHATGHDQLGAAELITVGEELHVANCYTQEFYGPGDKRYASVEAIEESLRGVYTVAANLNLDVYLPKIGAGLGGLDWITDVVPIIEELNSQHENVDTYICVI